MPGIFFIPARGRKLVLHDLAIIPSRFSLSPRGDGNASSSLSISNFSDFLYPREGTETPNKSAIEHTNIDFLYPREGTETPSCPPCPSDRLIFFIPARGRKRSLAGLWRNGTRFSLSPRGDGNASFSQSASCCCQIFFIPARGRHSQQKSTFLPSIYLQTARSVLNWDK